MIGKDLIREEIAPLDIDSRGNSAINKMMELNLSALPVVENKIFKGIITELSLKDMAFPEESIRSLQLEKPLVVANEGDHFLEIVHKMKKYGTGLLPIVGENGVYIGTIHQNSLLKYIADINAFKDPGGIIVLEMNSSDYSLVEISQIIEAEGARVLATYVEVNPESRRLTLTIKVNKLEIETILLAFGRYEYEIKASFRREDETEYLQERYDSLMNYLNI